MNTDSKIRVAVIFGGRSAEHEISLLSARFVLQALDRNRFEPVLIGIDKTGRWLAQEEALLLESNRDPRLVRLNHAAPQARLEAKNEAQDARLTLGEREASLPIGVVFPVLHGPMGEDGTLQGMLELANVPYVGAGVLGSAIGMDKDVMKRLLLHEGLPVLPYVCIRAADWKRDSNRILQQCDALAFPQFVKPANLGSSVGIARVTSKENLSKAIDDAFAYDAKVIVERGLDRPKEIEVSVLGGEDPIVSIAGEIVIDHPDGFYSYAAKYIDEHGASIRIPAQITEEQMKSAQALALRTFRTLECYGLARVDMFLAKNGELWVNEINTMPGFTAISMYPKLWQASGIGATELVSRLIDLALERRAKT